MTLFECGRSSNVFTEGELVVSFTRIPFALQALQLNSYAILFANRVFCFRVLCVFYFRVELNEPVDDPVAYCVYIILDSLYTSLSMEIFAYSFAVIGVELADVHP